MAYTQEQINRALAQELAARPGSSYDEILKHATATYGVSPDQIEQAYFDYQRDQGMNDADFNKWANANKWTEQDVFDARDTWLDSPEGQSWLNQMEDPLQKEWANTFWTGDMPAAEKVLNERKLGVNELVNNYGVSPNELNAIADRYAVVPYGSLPAQLAPTHPTQQQLAAGIKPRQMLDGSAPSASANPDWQQRQTVGAAGNAMLGAGNADYASELIKGLRIDSNQLRSNNPGVSMIPNGAAAPMTQTPASGGQSGANAFNPQMQDLPEWDPSPIFREIYGRDPTEQELAGTKFLPEKDLRTSLNYWWDQYQNQQNPAKATQPTPNTTVQFSDA